jgi:hypothetical protein
MKRGVHPASHCRRRLAQLADRVGLIGRLKIRVSVVRFRPRPPPSKPARNPGSCGFFLLAQPSHRSQSVQFARAQHKSRPTGAPLSLRHPWTRSAPYVVEPQGAGHEEIRYRQVAGVEPQQGPASEATDKRRGANSPSSNTQRTRGSAPKTADFDPTSKPQRPPPTRA